jgi:hypothetical protein
VKFSWGFLSSNAYPPDLAFSGIWWKTLCIAASTHIHVWFLCSVIGLPGEEDWPRDVALPRQAFHSKSAQPIEKFVTDIDELGKDLLLVSSCGTESTDPIQSVLHTNISSAVVMVHHKPQPCGAGSCRLSMVWCLLILECLSDPHSLNAPFLNMYLNTVLEDLRFAWTYAFEVNIMFPYLQFQAT